jgi:hypothetical protein
MLGLGEVVSVKLRTFKNPDLALAFLKSVELSAQPKGFYS